MVSTILCPWSRTSRVERDLSSTETTEGSRPLSTCPASPGVFVRKDGGAEERRDLQWSVGLLRWLHELVAWMA